MLRFDKFLHATDKAYLIRVGIHEHWLPKKLAWNLITNKKLGGVVTLPTWLYMKVTGLAEDEINLHDASYIVLKHVPSKKHPIVNNQPNPALLRPNTVNND